MKLVINSKNYNVSGFVKGEIEERFEKLSKYFTEDATVTVTFKGQKNQSKKVEITVKMKNAFLRSQVADFDVRIAMDKAIDKIENQLIRHKSKLRERSADSIRFEHIKDVSDEEVSRIVKNKTFALKPMTTEEACFQLELLEHSFYMFLNEKTNKVSVVYKRDDGDYGLIEAEL